MKNVLFCLLCCGMFLTLGCQKESIEPIVNQQEDSSQLRAAQPRMHLHSLTPSCNSKYGAEVIVNLKKTEFYTQYKVVAKKMNGTTVQTKYGLNPSLNPTVQVKMGYPNDNKDCTVFIAGNTYEIRAYALEYDGLFYEATNSPQTFVATPGCNCVQ